MLFSDADRYFTPLPLKSFNVYGGYRGNGPAPSDDFETFGQLVHSDAIWNDILELQRPFWKQDRMCNLTRITSENILKTTSLKHALWRYLKWFGIAETILKTMSLKHAFWRYLKRFGTS